MGDMLACLRGWHPGLARAELQALLPGAALASDVSPRWCRVEGATSAQREEALNVASSLQCFLLEGVVQSTQTVDKTAWLAIMQTYLDQHPVEGTVAVRAWKQGRKISGWSLSKLRDGWGACSTTWVAWSTSQSPITCWPSSPTGRRLRLLVDGWRATARRPSQIASERLVSAPSSNPSASTLPWHASP